MSNNETQKKDSKLSEKLFICNSCHKEYKRESWFKKHVCDVDNKETERKIDTPVKQDEREPEYILVDGKKIYPCHRCGTDFKTVRGIINHKCDERKIKAEKRKKQISRIYRCDNCSKKFKTELGLINHPCVPLLRKEEAKTPEGRQGFFAFHYYYKMAIYNSKREMTIDDYVKSKLYHNFYKFGKYIYKNEIKNMKEYVLYLHTYRVPIDDWCNDKVYTLFIRRVVMQEPADRAVERTFGTMDSWSKKNDTKWYEYFRTENKNKIVHHIRMGKISPWVIYNCSSGAEFLDKLDEKDLDGIFDYINPLFWNNKFEKMKIHTNAVRQTLNEVGL